MNVLVIYGSLSAEDEQMLNAFLLLNVSFNVGLGGWTNFLVVLVCRLLKVQVASEFNPNVCSLA